LRSDTVLLNRLRNTYPISFDGSSHSGSVSGSDGFDILDGIEVIGFDDGRFVFDVSDKLAVAYRMYDSAFNRAPDPSGLNGWTTVLQGGLSTADMASGFAASPEFQATYGQLSNVQFVEQLYQNVLNRQSDAAGLSHWT
jgi:hypothetical protein